jgi:hypothetical protein
MASYYIQTHEGPKGPYSAEIIRQGVQQGRIPANAQLNDANTGQSLLAAAVASDPAPQASGPVPPVNVAAPPRAFPARPASAPAYPQYGTPPAQQAHSQPYAQPYGGQQYAPFYPSKPSSGLAIASLVLTLTTFATCLPLSIGGIICGALALKETTPDGPKTGRGMAQWGLWLGVALTVIYAAVIGLFVVALSVGR